jgi:hypothetical protein
MLIIGGFILMVLGIGTLVITSKLEKKEKEKK